MLRVIINLRIRLEKPNEGMSIRETHYHSDTLLRGGPTTHFLEEPDIRVSQEKRVSIENHNSGAKYTITMKGGLRTEKIFSCLPPPPTQEAGSRAGRNNCRQWAH